MALPPQFTPSSEDPPSHSPHASSQRPASHSPDDDSSADTIQGSQRHSIRLTVCVVIEEGQNSTKVDFLTHLANELNNIVETCVKLNPDIKIIPWHQRSGLTHQSADLFKPCPVQFKALVYNFRPRSTHAGNHYFRINMSVPHEVTPSTLNEHLDGWYTNWPRFAKVAPSTAQKPTCVGWFLRSHRLQLSTDNHSHHFSRLSGCTTLGFDWRKIQDGSKWVKGKKNTNPFAIHVEVDESEKHMAEGFCRSTFNSTNFELSPFGVSWGFIPDISSKDMQNSRSALVHLSKCMVLQAAHIDQVVTIHITDVLDLRDNISDTQTISEWLMSLRISTMDKYKGDRVFLSVDHAGETLEAGWHISYHTAVADEAGSIARNIPLILRDEFHLDLTEYCPYGVDRSIADWKWDPASRSASSPIIESLEDMVQGCGSLLEVVKPRASEPDAETLDTVGKINYNRLNGREDDTVVGDSRTPLRPNTAPPPALTTTDAATVNSGLTEGTSESKRLQARKEAIAEKEAEFYPILEGYKSALDYERKFTEVQNQKMSEVHSKVLAILTATGQRHHIGELSSILKSVQNDTEVMEKRRIGLRNYQKAMNANPPQPHISSHPTSPSPEKPPMDIDLTHSPPSGVQTTPPPSTATASPEILEVYTTPSSTTRSRDSSIAGTRA